MREQQGYDRSDIKGFSLEGEIITRAKGSALRVNGRLLTR